MAVGDARVFPGFLTPVLIQISFQIHDYFSHMLQQRWEAEVRRKDLSPQPGLELPTTRSWVRHAYYWAIRVGLWLSKAYIFGQSEVVLLSKF